MEIVYDKDFEKVMTELQNNFGWSNIATLPDSYRDLLNDTIKAVKNIAFEPHVSKSLLYEAISHGYHSAIALKSEDEAKSTF